jgi:hypothetical protein
MHPHKKSELALSGVKGVLPGEPNKTSMISITYVVNDCAVSNHLKQYNENRYLGHK